MNFGNYTQKSLEAIRNAQQIAVENSNQQLEQTHILLALLLLLLLGKKTVTFDTGCAVKVKKQRVRKGSCALRPEDPACPGRFFAGWYKDEAKMVSWDFERDTVEENMTLYAKWM